MNNAKDILTTNLQAHRGAFSQLDAMEPRIAAAAEIMIDALQNGGRLFFCGNGGSAADAQHLAAEFTGRFKFDRRPLDAHALHVNTSSLTAVGNDYGFDQVFARGVHAHGRQGDVLVGISTSGRSPNVVLAMEAARALHMKTIAFTGIDGRDMGALADIVLNVPAGSTALIQEMHIFIGHTLCEIVEDALCASSASGL
jgi:D-sedoheptulose 7-phosphate isomerase